MAPEACCSRNCLGCVEVPQHTVLDLFEVAVTEESIVAELHDLSLILSLVFGDARLLHFASLVLWSISKVRRLGAQFRGPLNVTLCHFDENPGGAKIS